MLFHKFDTPLTLGQVTFVDNLGSIKQAAPNNTNELLKKNGMQSIDIAKDYVDADIGNPIVIGNCNSGVGGNEYECVSFGQAKELNLEMLSSKTQDLVWVKKSALDLAKEAIKRKESIEPRLVRAKND